MVFKCDGNLAIQLWAQWQSGEFDADLHMGKMGDDGMVVAYVRGISQGAMKEWLRLHAAPISTTTPSGPKVK